MGRISIRTRLILLLSVILFFSFMSVSIINYHVSKKSIRAEIVNSALPLTRDNIYSEIHAYLTKPIYAASLMANDTFLKDWAISGEKTPVDVKKYLTEIKNKYGFFTAFFVSNLTDNYYHFDGVLKKISRQDDHDVWYYRFIESEAEYDLDVDTNEAADNTLTIFINFRVTDYEGRLLGVTGVGLKMDLVAELLEKYQSKYNRRIFMVDPAGVIQVHQDKTLIEKKSLRELDGIKRIAEKILNHKYEPTNFDYELNGSHILLTARFIHEIGWFLLVEQDENSALIPIRDNLLRSITAGLLVTFFVIAVVVITVNHFQKKLELMATTDELTGLANRREFETFFENTMNRYARTRDPFSIIMLDLDDFKLVNDDYGHIEGDRVLKSIANIARLNIRSADILARWGGDEFIVLTLSDLDQAIQVAERIRKAVVQANAGLETWKPRITISCGIAQFCEGDTLDDLVKKADSAMYESKKAGKNKVVSTHEY